MVNEKKRVQHNKNSVNPVSYEETGLKMKLTAKPAGVRRIVRSYSSNRIARVMSPLEAEKKNRELNGNISTSFHRQSLRSKRLKARRTIALAPAPKPITANKSGGARLFDDARRVLLAHFSKIDFIFLLTIIAIAVIGILAVHSGSMTLPSHRRIDLLQFSAFFIGISAIILAPIIDLNGILKWWKWIYLLNVLILVVTLIFGYSPTGEENRSWINLGFTSIQPAEFSKILFIMTLSAHLEKLHDRINTLDSIFRLLLHAGVIIGLVLAERDWGNALVFIVIFVVMVFCAKIDLRYLIGCFAMLVVAFPLVWENLGEFRKKRVLIGFNPELDPHGYGHQVIRSRNAIASGGLLGQGYLNGETIQRPGALFAQHTDMVFAVIGQEFGFIGCAAVILIYAAIVTKIVSIASKSGDYAGTYLCCGVAGMFIFQFVINIGMALGITPVVGITLPLVSYGASSLVAMYSALALVMAVYAGSKSYSYKSL